MKNRKFIIGLVLFIVLAVVIPMALWVVSTNAPATISGNVTVQEAHARVSEGALLLDVRTYEEWDEVHVPGAVLIPLDELELRVDELPNDIEIVVMCRSGNRSQTGRDILLNAGFENVASMDGGINEWILAGYEIE